MKTKIIQCAERRFYGASFPGAVLPSLRSPLVLSLSVLQVQHFKHLPDWPTCLPSLPAVEFMPYCEVGPWSPAGASRDQT